MATQIAEELEKAEQRHGNHVKTRPERPSSAQLWKASLQPKVDHPHTGVANPVLKPFPLAVVLNERNIMVAVLPHSRGAVDYGLYRSNMTGIRCPVENPHPSCLQSRECRSFRL